MDRQQKPDVQIGCHEGKLCFASPSPEKQESGWTYASKEASMCHRDQR